MIACLGIVAVLVSQTMTVRLLCAMVAATGCALATVAICLAATPTRQGAQRVDKARRDLFARQFKGR